MPTTSSVKFNIRKFDLSKMSSDAVIVMLAKRRSGKSYLCRDILYNQRKIPDGVVISPTEKASPYYRNFIPEIFIYDDYSPEIVAKLLKRQEKRIQKRRSDDNRTFLVMDDCLYDNKWVKDVPIRNIFMNGRHYKVMYLLLMQYPLGITPALRSNIDYVFLLKEPNLSNRKRLYEHYAGVFPTFDMFSETLDKLTEDYSCMVIDNTSRMGKIEDSVFWYKAQERKDFRVGGESYWKYHDTKFDKNYKKRQLGVGIKKKFIIKMEN